MTLLLKIRNFFALLCVFKFTTAEAPIGTLVQLEHGKIRGHVLKSETGNDYYAFQEIPYAAPPVGKNRFRLPQKPNNWTGILDTRRNTKICYQAESKYSNLEISEDCLYLNVYTPVRPGSNVQKLPVLAWIHGGNLTAGTGAYENYGPKYIMDHSIVVVTLNYRLGTFGFTTTEDDIIPGNLGLKDQKFALEWIQRNIHLFGGDPKQVTIDGVSAGSFAVGAFLLGQWENEELFRGVIMQSGSPLAGVMSQSNGRENAFSLGRALDKSFTSNSSSDLLKLLQKVSAADILATAPIFGTAIIEKHGDFSYNPLQTFMDGNFKKVPIMMGFTSEEFIYFASISKIERAQYDRDPSLLVMNGINMSPENRTIAGQRLKELYTNTSFADDYGAYLRWLSDSMMNSHVIKLAQLISSQTPFYLYQFSYDGKIGQGVLPAFNISGVERVAHGEDVHYMWDDGSNSDLSKFSEEDQLTLHRFVKMWTNFVKYQNPTPVVDTLLDNTIWPTTNGDNLQYLNFNITMEVEDHPRQLKQVQEILDEYIEPPFIFY